MKRILCFLIAFCILLIITGCKKAHDEQYADALLFQKSKQSAEQNPDTQSGQPLTQSEPVQTEQKTPEPEPEVSKQAFTSDCWSEAYEGEQSGTHTIKTAAEYENFLKQYDTISKMGISKYSAGYGIPNKYPAEYFKTHFLSVQILYEDYYGIDYSVTDLSKDGKITLVRSESSLLSYPSCEKLVWFIFVGIEKGAVDTDTHFDITEQSETQKNPDFVPAVFETYSDNTTMSCTVGGVSIQTLFRKETENAYLMTSYEQFKAFTNKYLFIFENAGNNKVILEKYDEQYFETNNLAMMSDSNHYSMSHITKNGDFVMETSNSGESAIIDCVDRSGFYVFEFDKSFAPQTTKKVKVKQ